MHLINNYKFIVHRKLYLNSNLGEI